MMSSHVHLARCCSAALVLIAVHCVTRIDFAREALDLLAEEGRTMLLPVTATPKGSAS